MSPGTDRPHSGAAAMSSCHVTKFIILQFYSQFDIKKVEQGSFQEIWEFCFQPAGPIIFVICLNWQFECETASP